MTTGGTGARNVYVHEPALLPIRNPNPLADWPDIVHSVEELSVSDATRDFIHIQVLSSSPILQENSENAVRATPSEVARIVGTSETEPGMSLQDVDVLPWEMTSAVMEVLSVPGNVVLATSEETLGNAGNSEVWQFYIPISNDNNDLKSTLKSGRYSLRVSYSYLGSEPAKSASIRSISKQKLQEGFDDVLTSYQLAEGDPIMQAERQEMTRDLQQAVALSIDANDLQLVELIMNRQFSVLMQDLFVDQPDPMAIEDLISERSLEAVEAYLTPMYRELENVSRNYEETTISEEDRRTVDVGFGVNIKGVKVGFDVKQEDLDKIEEKFGVEFKSTENTKVMIPHSIDVSFFASNQVSALNRLAFSIQVENAKIASYSRSEVIPASMLVSEDYLGGVVPNLTYGVPVGTAFCSFLASEKAPFGYQWMEEGNKWPNMALFGSLADQQMPSMNNVLVGATETIENVGNVWSNGSVIVAGADVLGSNFSVSGTTMVGATTTMLNLSLQRTQAAGITGGPIQGAYQTQYLKRNPPKKTPVNFGYGLKFIPLTTWSQISSNPDDPWGPAVSPLVAKTFNAPESIGGSVSIPSQTLNLNEPQAMPNHIKCRWMVKVH
ncbi:hypothetical protein [Ruegeria sp. HKCCD6109]|uniref:hypothetical protein n=1 Tax=Ruegeria sp. HKCCD6109 TaxID=2683017 RepID=UPI001491D8DB|nr:hypothetical protein [Ruegeria sp. HKCCD6109]NOD62719.1 hypothetical protein [Ruegeria sp. HKCCD6109]